MSAPTHVVVDGRALTDASSFRGIGTYVREILSGLAVTPGIRLSVLARAEAPVPDAAELVRTHRIAPGRYQHIEHELLLPLDLLRRQADVVLSPALDPPAFSRAPWVQTLHDAWPALADDSGADPARWRRQSSRYRKATAVITVSRWSADGAVRLLGIDPSRLHVVPHGIAPHFTPGDARADPPYILFVGEFDPRKRHDLAFAAVGALADQGLPHRLLVTGRIAPWFAEQMERLVAESPHPDRVEMLGHVDTPTLVRLYQEAAALVVTSRGEGFGLPALEAMACGTPVVAFANSATTEVLGDAGILVPDGDFEEFVRALSALVKDPARIEELAEQGFERAKQFSWPASVAAHAEILAAAAT